MAEGPTTAGGISVVIPAYGACPHLAQVLAALSDGTSAPDEIIVSHSGPENPAAELAHVFPAIRWLHSPERLFAGAARNAGARVANGSLLAFCDSDVLPDQHWLARIRDLFDQGERLVMVGAVGVARDGGYWGMSNWICEFSEQAPWRPAGEQAGGASCNMAVRASDFQAIGGFPNDLAGGEDTIFFALARAAGCRQHFRPEIAVGHFNNHGLSAFARHQYAIGKGFAETRLMRDLPGKTFVRIPPLTLLLWIPKSLVVLKRAFLGGAIGIGQGLTYFPGILLGSLIFTAGAFTRTFWTAIMRS